MKVSAAFFRTVLLAATLGVATACSDDDDGNGPSAPATPTGLAAVLQDDGSIEVTWNAVTDATSYTLERNEAGGAFTQVGGALSAASFTDTDVEQDVEYGYHVAAVNAVGSSGFSATVTVTSEGPRVATLSGDITADRTLFADTVYTLQGYV
jgi:fibronectin type 3 domain-containing protein